VLSYANQLMLLPVALFGIAVSASSLPEFARDRSALAQEAVREALRVRVQDGWVRILFYVVPSAVVFVGFGDLVIGILLRSGAFGLREQALVHGTLAAYAVGLVSFATNRLFAAVFHARQDYRAPLRYSMVSVAVSIGTAAASAYAFRTHAMAVAGIAFGAAIGSWVNFTLLSTHLRRDLGGLLQGAARAALRRVALCTVVAASAAGALRLVSAGWHRLLEGAVVLGMFSAVYLLLSWWLGSTEAARWLRLSPRRVGAS
jgi:putative peptidoglycan lipid II flippase